MFGKAFGGLSSSDDDLIAGGFDSTSTDPPAQNLAPRAMRLPRDASERAQRDAGAPVADVCDDARRAREALRGSESDGHDADRAAIGRSRDELYIGALDLAWRDDLVLIAVGSLLTLCGLGTQSTGMKIVF